MSIVESLSKISDKAVDAGEQYLESTQKYAELKIFQQLVSTTSFLLKFIILGGLFFLGLTFSAVAGVIALSKLLESMTQALMLVAGILFLITVLVYLFRKYIDKKLIKKLSKTYFN
ncbi:hypothetical protein ACFQ1M_05035 [Sungkyunkwania multivorans]|uniref:Phage holin family protein n=1 Tax=Sungkyunkwania multivorans TaxID=1173618 RepID=A0ABW3CUV9_9FLAO